MNCYHCGQNCEEETLVFDEKSFCCNGCKSVYEILTLNSLETFYELNQQSGITPENGRGKFDFLDTEEIFNELIDFEDEKYVIVEFNIPVIHCSSCIWLLESLQKIHPNIYRSTVNFTNKTVRITYVKEKLSLSELAEFLTKLGYKPAINLANDFKGVEHIDRSLSYKIGIAGFCFGNIMLFAFPEYLEESDVWLEKYKEIFRWLSFSFSLPVLFYCALDYYKSAYKGLKQGFLNIDVPISLGIFVLFFRSFYELIANIGAGYFDSLGGLIFFLLLGKYFQQRTYKSMSFERDYKSYYPIAVTRLKDKLEENILLSKLKVGDRILIRNEEIIPADGILIKGNAQINNSFVTGESRLNRKESGDLIYAGGKQEGEPIEIEVVKEVDQSYLTQLWQHESFTEDKESFQTITTQISKYFTIVILGITLVTALYWFFTDTSKIFQTISAVLIVACPCALALSAPFTLGNMLRLFSRNLFYLKESSSIEKLSKIDHIVFDKTGTLTQNDASETYYSGEELTNEELAGIKSIIRASNHPLSRALYKHISLDYANLESFEEKIGEGLIGVANGVKYHIGSTDLTQASNKHKNIQFSKVHISVNNIYKGCFVFKNKYRKSINELMAQLKEYSITVLSGDNDSEAETLHKIIPNATLLFNQKPQDKLHYIKQLQQTKKVMMIGDGLNDAGALKQSNVGITITEDVNSFSPACDGILDAKQFKNIFDYLELSKTAMCIIKWSFTISFMYNIVGLSFAVTGNLSPLVAAILMPVSSITVVIFATVASAIVFKRRI